MAGNKSGGQLAAQKNKEKHGEDFYRRIGAIGGKNGNTGGFASPIVCKNKKCPQRSLWTQHLIRECAGARGGRKSRRTK